MDLRGQWRRFSKYLTKIGCRKKLENSCSVLKDELLSKSLVLSAGGASSYVGALVMALGSMVGNLTLGIGESR